MRIDSKDLPLYKVKIQAVSRIQPVVYSSGVFEIHDLDEVDKDRIIHKLRQLDFLSDIRATAAKYDFRHFKFDKGFVEPGSKYTVSGIISKEISEAAEKYKWSYSGNAYQFNDILGHVELETVASSFKQAVNNFKFQAAETFGIDRADGEHVDIDDFDVEKGEKIISKSAPIKSFPPQHLYKKCDDCGATLTDSGECPVCDLGDESALEESIQAHTILNPKLWDAQGKLFPEIRIRIQDLVKVFVDLLKEKGVELHVVDAYIIGSNANYNYTAFSDLDVHIIVDEDNDCIKKHLSIIYNAYRTIFENKYDISIKGISVELYVQSVESTLNNISSGVYSIKENEWLKKPLKDFKIPEIDDIKFARVVNDWERKYFNVKINPSIDSIEKFIDDIYVMRNESLTMEGEFGFGNLVFKEIRSLGYLDDLKELKDSLIEQKLSLE